MKHGVTLHVVWPTAVNRRGIPRLQPLRRMDHPRRGQYRCAVLPDPNLSLRSTPILQHQRSLHFNIIQKPRFTFGCRVRICKFGSLRSWIFKQGPTPIHSGTAFPKDRVCLTARCQHRAPRFQMSMLMKNPATATALRFLNASCWKSILCILARAIVVPDLFVRMIGLVRGWRLDR